MRAFPTSFLLLLGANLVSADPTHSQAQIDSSLDRQPEFSPDWFEPVPPPESPPASTQAFGPIIPAARQPAGALSGRIVFMNAGHGWTYDPSYWRLLRGNLNEMNEAYGNLDQMNLFAAHCFNAGAVLVPLRPLGQQTNEVVLDNDDPEVSWSGSWADSASSIFFGSAGDVPYRYASLSATESAAATYTPNIPVAGHYPVYTWVRAGSDRGDQLYRVRHTSGETQVRIPHHMVGNGWVYLGEYYFTAGANPLTGSVLISNLRSSPAGSVVIADAIRFGNGMGSINRGGGVSGYPREDESCRYWIQVSLGQGQSSTIYDGSGGDESDTWSGPPSMCAEMNREAVGNIHQRICISFHSNAGGGRGTVALITGDPTPNQSALAQILGREVNDDLVALGSPPLEVPWYNRSTVTYSGGYSEIDGSLINYEMNSTILEVAFHDSVDDARLLRDPKARSAVGKAALHGVIRYMNQFDGVSLIFPPDPPANVRAAGAGGEAIDLEWDTPSSTGGSGAPTGYVIYRSTDGLGFGNPIVLGEVTSHRLAGLAAGAEYYFRVAAVNAGGESPPSELAGCRVPSREPAARVLVVNGFDRFDRTTNLRQNTGAQNYAPPNSTGAIERVWPRRVNAFDYVVPHGQALGAFGLPFDSCQNEAVANGQVALGDYRVVIWASGQESTLDETFSSAEQSLVADFRNAGGRLFVSGSEIGWDLDRSSGPTAADRGFFNGQLKARLASDADDNSQSYNVTTAPDGIFAGRPNATFDNGSRGIYWVQTPDVLTPVGVGAKVALSYSGNSSGPAAIQYDGSDGGGKVVLFGFPFETIASRARREQYMADILEFLTAGEVTLVAVGTTWKYDDRGANLGTAWRQPGFDDAAWPAGPAQLGFGDDDVVTPVNSDRTRVTTYFRHTFAVTNLAELETVMLRLKRDDGAVVYLNGTEVFRSNLPEGEIGADTFASVAVGGTDESAWWTTNVPLARLVAGMNLLAVELHQHGTNSSDLSFDLELLATLRPPLPVTFVAPGSVWRFRDDAVDLGAAWRENGYDDASWKSGPAMIGFGDANGVLPTTRASNNAQWTTYFRCAFLVPDAGLVRSLTARMQRDDGAVVYLNGTEVWRSNLPLPPTNIVYSTAAETGISGASETEWHTQALDPAWLVAGHNLLAAEIHQNGTNSSDIVFDFALEATVVSFARPALAAAAADNTLILTAPPEAGYLQLYSATNLSEPVQWMPAPVTPVFTNGAWTLAIPILSNRQSYFRLATP